MADEVKCIVPPGVVAEVVDSSVSLQDGTGTAYLASSYDGQAMTNAFRDNVSSIVMGEGSAIFSMKGNPNDGLVSVNNDDALKHHAQVLEALGVHCTGEAGMVVRPNVQDLLSSLPKSQIP